MLSPKKYLYFIALCCFTLIKPCTPENTTLVWDLNGVLIKSDPYAMLCAVWNCPDKCDILRRSISTVIQLYRSSSSHPSTFEEYIQMCKSCNPCLAQLMRTMNGCQKLSLEMVELINELHMQGYTLGIATNMGAETLDELKQKHPEFFEKFSVVASPDTIDPTGSFIKKPDVQFFKLFQEQFNKTGNLIVFIDDRTRNVKAAEQAGMQGISFKNHAQLRSELKKLNILP